MRYEKRWENSFEHGYESGYASMDISPGMLRGLNRASQELLLRAAHALSGKPIEVLRREMLRGGLRLVRGGKA
jgi:hypothetical protein